MLVFDRGFPGAGMLAFVLYFASVVSGVMLLINAHNRFAKTQRHMRRAKISAAAKHLAETQVDQYRTPFTVALSGGILMLCLSIVPAAELTTYSVGPAFYFIFNGIGIGLIVYTSMIRAGYKLVARN